MPNVAFDDDRFLRSMEKLVNAAPHTIQPDRSLASLANWDSLTILEFMVIADSDYNSEIQPDEVAACKTVDDLAGLLKHNERTAGV